MELIIVLTVLLLLLSSSSVVFGGFINRNALRYKSYQLVQDAREARTNAVSQNHDSSWGIHFDDTSAVHGYTFFKGDSYANRDASFDRDVQFPAVLRISRLSFGPSDEVVFEPSSGFPGQGGNLILSANDRDVAVSINSLGLVEYDL